MNVNIIEEYVTYIKNGILKFYKICLNKKYNKGLIENFLDKYLEVRYYNETNFPREKDLVERVSKELLKILKDLVTKENEDLVKTIYALFGYVFYFDDCYFVENDRELLKTLFEDENLKIEFNSEIKKEITSFLRNFRNEKEKYLNILKSNQFYVDEKRINKNLYQLELKHNVRISNLYSDYAIEKAFNMGTVNEDKLFVLLAMASDLLLQNAINLDFSRHYLVDFVSTYFEKNKKMERLFKVIDNLLAKKSLTINITYKDYLFYKDTINDLVKSGFSLAITLDDTFDEDYSNFVLFSYVFLYDTNKNYDMIIENKSRISSKLIVL